MRLTDTHCHLTVEQFESEVNQLLARARSAGVERLVVPGIDLPTSRAAVELAEREPGVYAAVGVHPHGAQHWSDGSRSALRALAASPAVVAIGEIGLDYYRELSPRPQQRKALAAQLELAGELDKPVILHNREAAKELLALLIEWAAGLKAERKLHAGVLHAFSGDQQEAEAAIESGFYIGVAGPVTYPNAAGLRSAIRALPVERLLLETDSPYLAPQARRGARNEPSYLPYVAHGLAAVLGVGTPTAADRTSSNATALFSLNNGNQNP